MRARVRAGDGPAEETAVDAGVAERAGHGVGEGAREESALVGEERLAPEEQEFHLRESAAGRRQVLGEPHRVVGVPATTWAPKSWRR